MFPSSISPSELKSVTKPAQYMGGEIGAVVKPEAEVDFRFCLAFPDTYEVGMSHVGIQILYDVINRDPHAWAERVYVPLPDMEALLRSKSAELVSLEAKRPLREFDVIGFSLQYELCGTGILTILDLAGLPLLARDRKEHHPLIIGGGPFTYHPEPIADFFDAFFVGDAEEGVSDLITTLRRCKERGATRQEKLLELRKIEGLYIPSLFEPRYEDQSNERGRFLGMQPLLADYTEVKRRLLPSLENAPYPTKPVIPNIKAVHDRLSVEVMRGCVRGCRFCQAGYLYRPQRERKPEQILKIIQDTLPNTGYEELSLLSLSTADYCSILPLLSSIKERFCQDDQLVVSFPSTRVDALTPELLQEVQSVRRTGFTMAPEAGTQRLRDVINKGVTDEEIIATCQNVFGMGWNHVKLYFMLGLPTETDEDLYGIIELAQRIKQIAKRNEVTVSVSTHVPKPHTPFQWAEQISQGETVRKQQLLFRGLKAARVEFRYHKAFSSFLEGAFARGDRRLGKVLLRAYQLGCRLDGWVEEVKEDIWMQAFAEFEIDPHHYLHAIPEDQPLPWDHISCDIPKRYFLKEWQRANAARVTPDCLTETCSNCGVCNYDDIRNVLFDRKRTSTRLGIVNQPWEEVIAARAAKAESIALPAVAPIKLAPELDLPAMAADPEFGSGSLDYIPKEDFPFKHPKKPVEVHENIPHGDPHLTDGKAPVQRIRLRYGK